jgi:hypothetical protein
MELLQSIVHPSELFAIAHFALGNALPNSFDFCSPNEKWCFEMVLRISKSFAHVIIKLQTELRVAVSSPNFHYSVS